MCVNKSLPLFWTHTVVVRSSRYGLTSGLCGGNNIFIILDIVHKRVVTLKQEKHHFQIIGRDLSPRIAVQQLQPAAGGTSLGV